MSQRMAVGAAAVVAVAVAVLAGLALRGNGTNPATTAEDDPGLVHVHGLGVDPADGTLFAATHTGLFRVEDGDAERVGDRYQDTMGFAVAGPGRFLASGHPDSRDDHLRVAGKPPLLGLIESTDGGRTWRAVSLLGEADFHAIAISGDTVVAYNSTGGRVMVSDDGRRWETRASVPLVDLAVDPADADHVVAIAADGSAIESTDGARTFGMLAAASPPARPLVLRWGADGLFAGTVAGEVLRLGDGAWTSIRQFRARVEAIDVGDGEVHVAVEGAGIFRSEDRGATWEKVYRPGT